MHTKHISTLARLRILALALALALSDTHRLQPSYAWYLDIVAHSLFLSAFFIAGSYDPLIQALPP
eukprot:3937190-Rhodomonas_salina.2